MPKSQHALKNSESRCLAFFPPFPGTQKHLSCSSQTSHLCRVSTVPVCGNLNIKGHLDIEEVLVFPQMTRHFPFCTSQFIFQLLNRLLQARHKWFFRKLQVIFKDGGCEAFRRKEECELVGGGMLAKGQRWTLQLLNPRLWIHLTLTSLHWTGSVWVWSRMI